MEKENKAHESKESKATEKKEVMAKKMFGKAGGITDKKGLAGAIAKGMKK